MNTRKLLSLTLCLLFSVGVIVTSLHAATIFTGSRIIAIDEGQRTITFRTREGQTWTLPVTDPNLLNKQVVAQDQAVTIEIDLNDRIINVVKPSEAATAPPTSTEDR